MNLPPGLSRRDLEHIYGSSEPPCANCGHPADDHYAAGDATYPCDACSCPDYEPQEDPRFG